MEKLDTDSFLKMLTRMTGRDEQMSKMSFIDPDDPKLYWILRDADFKSWEAANNSEVLWLFGGPSGCAMTEVSSLIANQEESRRNGAVFYFSCAMEGSDAITAFTHSILRHVLNGSNPTQDISFIETFLHNILFQMIQRDRPRFQKHPGDSSVIEVNDIINARGCDHLEALTEAVAKMYTIPDTPIIIDGINKIGPYVSRFLTKFCSQSKASPKPKVLLTCGPVPNIKEIVDTVPCIIIEYDKERQGLGTSYLVVTLAN